jgi:hypothetical protein
LQSTLRLIPLGVILLQHCATGQDKVQLTRVTFEQ